MSSWPRLNRAIAWATGGERHGREIVLFACTFALDGADKGAIGAMAEPLQHALGIGNTDLGLLLTVSLGVGAAATLPCGWLADRVNRTRLLSWTVALWAVAMGLSAMASSYTSLLLARLMLGGVTAAAGPTVASLLGDTFRPSRRGAVYSQVLSGEILGTGVGFLLAGELAAWTWRAGFVALGVPALALAWALRQIPEPARGRRGQKTSNHEQAKDGRDAKVTDAGGENGQAGGSSGRVRDIARKRHVEPRASLVLGPGEINSSLWWALRYVVKIPTNVVLIIASALGYFYLTGLRAFGVEYLHTWFDIGHAMSVLLIIAIGGGALGGVLVSGRLADWLLARGRLDARVTVAAISYLASGGVLFVALLTSRLWIGLPLLALGAALLGAINPPLDAARLDIMHPALWGRAEAVRTFLRKGGEALAPLTFGVVASSLFGGHGRASGLLPTFLLMTGTLVAGGIIGLKARHTYPRDVATVQASLDKEGRGRRP